MSFGIGGNIFLPLLAILFIALKLTHYIHWHWIWVLSPFWIPFIVGILNNIVQEIKRL